ncbi:MAG TPA: hypothetical protein DCZ75_10705 [Geobacter sp.]|nr:hypothetical protein [Geobacter sp.]
MSQLINSARYDGPETITLRSSVCRAGHNGERIAALFCCTSRLASGTSVFNTPAMPLNDAHFGGFFAFGGCQ